MIYIHNESITGINTHNKSIDRVYKGNRLVWLRDSTADSFTIEGDDSIVETKPKTFRAKYAGSDDISYTWSFTYANPDSISYNHNHRKVTVEPVRGSYGNYMTITCIMQRKGRDPLTATKEVEILEYRGIDGFSINDTIFDITDSSVMVELNTDPAQYKGTVTVIDASVDNDGFEIDETNNYYVSIINTVPISNTVVEFNLSVEVEDLFNVVFRDTAKIYAIRPTTHFTVNGEDAHSTPK